MIRFVPWSEVGTIEVGPENNVVEVGAFELAEGADTLWVRMTNTGTPGPWPWSYGILSFKTDEGQPLGSIKAYNSYDGEVFRLGVGLPPSVRAGVLTFEPRGFNMAWIKQGNKWNLKFEAQSGGGTVSSGYWNRDPENKIITPKNGGDNLDMRPGWIKAKNLFITDGSGGTEERSVPGYQSGAWDPAPSNGTINPAIPGRNRWSRIGQTVFLYGYVQDMSSRENALIEIYGAPYEAVDVTSGSAASSSIKTPAGGMVICYIQSLSPGDPPRIRFLSTSDAATGKWESGKYSLIDNISNSIYFSLAYQTPDTSWKPIDGTVF